MNLKFLKVYQTQKKCIGLFALLAVLFLGCPIVGQATDGTLNFYVTPVFPESQIEGSDSYFDLNLAPGETERLSLRLQNASNETIYIEVTPHTAYTNVHGVVEYGKDATEPDNSLSHALDEMIEHPEMIELQGNESKEIDLILHMPDTSFQGVLAGGLRIIEVKEDQEESVSSEEGVAIENEFAYVIGIVVSNSRDSVKQDIALLDVFADQLNYRNVISATIQNFTSTFVNRMTIEATVQKADENEILYEAREEMMQMAPNSHFHFPISLEGDRFQSGEYVLNLTATSGEDQWSWTQTFTIEAEEARALNRKDVMIDSAINWWMIGAVSLLLLFVATLVYLIYQKRKASTE